MQNILETVLRAGIGFAILLALTRLIGKKQLGQLTIFTYITGIALGNIAGDMVVHADIEIVNGIVGMSLWAAFVFLVEFFSLKSNRVRVALDGEPTIVIKKGEIMQDKLKRQRLNMDDLTMLLRTNNVFSICDVEYAILEPNGQLSVFKKGDKQQVTKKDMNIKTTPVKFIPAEIIVDGKLVQKNLAEYGLSNSWLKNELSKAGVSSVSEVFFAEIQSDRSLYISRKKSR